MLHFTRKLIAAYKRSPEIGWGEFTILEREHSCVLAHSLAGATGRLLAVHNFAPVGRTVTLTLPGADSATRVVGLLCDRTYAFDDDGRIELHLEGYDHVWLRLADPGEKRTM